MRKADIYIYFFGFEDWWETVLFARKAHIYIYILGLEDSYLHLWFRGLMRKADIYIYILGSEDWWEKVTFTDSEGIAHCKVARLTEWGFSISQSVRLAFLSRRPKALSSVIWKLIAAQAPNGPFLLQVLHFLLSLNKFVIYTSEMRVSAICIM